MLCPVTTHAICSLIPVQYTSCVPLCFVTGHSSCAARQQFAVPRYETQRGTGIVLYRKQRLNRLFRNGAQELYVTIWKSIYLIRRNWCAPLRNRAFTPCAPLCFALCFVTGHSSCAPLWACARLSASSRCAVCTRRYSTHMPHPYVPRAHDVRIIHKKRRKPYLLDADAPFRTQVRSLVPCRFTMCSRCFPPFPPFKVGAKIWTTFFQKKILFFFSKLLTFFFFQH